MKKLVLTSLLTVFAISSASAANNWFVGGGAGFESEKNGIKAVTVAPEFGMHMTDRLDLGIAANLTYAHNGHMEVDDLEHAGLRQELRESGLTDVDFNNGYKYGADAFVRYNIVSLGQLGVLIEGKAGFSALSVHEGETDTFWSLHANVAPMVIYELSPAFTLYTRLNFLGVQANYDFKNKDCEVPSYWTVNAIADSNDAFNTGDIQVGFYYNF